MRTIFVVMAALGLCFASDTERYSITLLRAAVVAGSDLEPGRYNLSLTGDQVELRKGDARVAARVQVETAGDRFPSTTLRLKQDNKSGKYRINEIRLGGTTRRLIFPAE